MKETTIKTLVIVVHVRVGKKFKVFLDMIYQNGYNYTGHKIAPNTVTNVTKIIALATKIQKLVAKLATRIL